METAPHIAADRLRELYERTGLSILQFASLFGSAERRILHALSSSGLQGDRYARHYERVSKATAELELEAVRELTPAVAFNTPKLRELMVQKFFHGEDGNSNFHRLRAQLG